MFKEGIMNWDDLQLKNSYGSFKAYSQSKLANVLFTKYLAKKLEGKLENQRTWIINFKSTS